VADSCKDCTKATVYVKGEENSDLPSQYKLLKVKHFMKLAKCFTKTRIFTYRKKASKLSTKIENSCNDFSRICERVESETQGIWNTLMNNINIIIIIIIISSSSSSIKQPQHTSVSHSHLHCHQIFKSVFKGSRGTRWRSGWGTVLHAGRLRVRFPMVSLELFIHIILPAALWHWGWLSL
jgi:hypothetical protein